MRKKIIRLGVIASASLIIGQFLTTEVVIGMNQQSQVTRPLTEAVEVTVRDANGKNFKAVILPARSSRDIDNDLNKVLKGSASNFLQNPPKILSVDELRKLPQGTANLTDIVARMGEYNIPYTWEVAGVFNKEKWPKKVRTALNLLFFASFQADCLENIWNLDMDAIDSMVNLGWYEDKCVYSKSANGIYYGFLLSRTPIDSIWFVMTDLISCMREGNFIANTRHLTKQELIRRSKSPESEFYEAAQWLKQQIILDCFTLPSVSTMVFVSAISDEEYCRRNGYIRFRIEGTEARVFVKKDAYKVMEILKILEDLRQNGKNSDYIGNVGREEWKTIIGLRDGSHIVVVDYKRRDWLQSLGTQPLIDRRHNGSESIKQIINENESDAQQLISQEYIAAQIRM